MHCDQRMDDSLTYSLEQLPCPRRTSSIRVRPLSLAALSRSSSGSHTTNITGVHQWYTCTTLGQRTQHPSTGTTPRTTPQYTYDLLYTSTSAVLEYSSTTILYIISIAPWYSLSSTALVHIIVYFYLLWRFCIRFWTGHVTLLLQFSSSNQ